MSNGRNDATTRAAALVRAEQVQTTLDITNALLGTLSTADPVRALASRIGSLCRGTAIIYDIDGNVVASSGEAPARLIWNEVSATSRQELRVVIGRWHVRTRRVSLRDAAHVLAIASRGTGTFELVGDQLLDTSERLLGAVYGIQHGATLRDRRDNEELLATLHDGILPSREHRYWARLSHFRFPAYSDLRALEFGRPDGASATEDDVAALITASRADDVPLLITLHRANADVPATVSALVADSEASERWLDGAARLLLTGASAPFSVLAQVPAAMHKAETALSVARSRARVLPSPGPLAPVRIDRIDLSTWLLAHVDQRELRQHIERLLEPLRQGALLETLITYLAADQNVVRAAEALFVHPNTVRYRLASIEKLLGGPIGAAATVANLTLALYPEILGRRDELGRAPADGSPPEAQEGASARDRV